MILDISELPDIRIRPNSKKRGFGRILHQTLCSLSVHSLSAVVHRVTDGRSFVVLVIDFSPSHFEKCDQLSVSIMSISRKSLSFESDFTETSRDCHMKSVVAIVYWMERITMNHVL